MGSAESAHVLDYYARHFRQGMVDLSTSSPSSAAGTGGERLGYAPPGGLRALRQAIAELYPGIEAEQVVVTNGATEALAATAFALIRPGERVLAGEEIYPSFREVALRLGAELSCHSPAVVVVNNPTVPDGRLADLRPLIATLESDGAFLVADEVYLDLRSAAPGVPAVLLSTAAVSVGDLSKPLGLGGLRIGWAVCQDKIVVERIAQSVQLLSGGPSVPAMEAGLAAVLNYETAVAARTVAAATNAPLLFAALDEAGWSVRVPEAGWTFLAQPPEPLRTWQLRRLEAHGYFLVPGSAFGAGNGYRMSRFAPVDAVREALNVLSTSDGKQYEEAAHERGSLVLLAKSAQPGVGKTRLARELGVCQAATLASAFLRDTVALAQYAGHRLTVAFTPTEAAAEITSLAPGATVVGQPEGELGTRLSAALAEGLRRGDTAVLIGSDTPQLAATVIDDAFRALRTRDLVVGPATDGGFYLIGIRETVSTERLFQGIAWSTPVVLSQLIANALGMGLAYELLDECTDVDDVESLASVLAQAGVSGAAAHTWAAAERLGLVGKG